MRPRTAIAVGLALWLAPALASACPSCAQGNDGGTPQTVVLGLFVLFPFVVAAAVYFFFIRALLKADGTLPPPDAAMHAIGGEK